jgi:phosphoribosyl-dephospho-CoA transferase
VTVPSRGTAGPAAQTAGPRPHDLLRLSDPAALQEAPCTRGVRPDWLASALAEALWTVVRRAVTPAGTVAVGVRGPRRGDRWAGVVALDAVAERVAPEELLHRPAPRDLPLFAAVDTLRTLPPPGWVSAWGPGGSAGFELATGRPTAHRTSDLDLIVRAGAPVAPHEVAAMLQVLATRLPVRADVQLQTPYGGIAAAEWARGEGTVLLRTDRAPLLVADPWREPPVPDAELMIS